MPKITALTRSGLLTLSVLLALACGGDGSATTDAGPPDGGQADGGRSDSGQPDTGLPDAGPDDAGVQNTAPTASAGDDQVSLVDYSVTLNGSGADVDGDTLTYAWTQTAGPTVMLNDTTSATPSFGLRQVGVYEFSLVVNDGTDDSAAATTTVRVHDINGGEDHTVALQPDGTLWAWGRNTEGQLGDGTLTSRATPARVCNTGASDCDADPLTGVVAISTGRFNTLALKADGTVWSWGSNSNGQLGIGAAGGNESTPQQVCDVGQTDCASNPLTGVVAIAAGYLFSAVLKADGSVWAWGINTYGELGNGTFGVPEPAPVQVCASGESSPCATFLTGIDRLSAGGGGHTLALDMSGTLWSWGHNKSAQLGNGTWTLQQPTPVRVCDTGDTAPCSAFITDVVDTDAWSGHSLLRKSDGTLWGFGGNDESELGAITTDLCSGAGACSQTPIAVCLTGDSPCTTPLDQVAAFAAGRRFSTALREDSTVWTWGDNTQSQLGTGDQTLSIVPVQVCAVGETFPCASFLSGVVAVTTGSYHTVALMSDGSLVSWGDNDNGQTGTDTTMVDVSIPVVVPGY